MMGLLPSPILSDRMESGRQYGYLAFPPEGREENDPDLKSGLRCLRLLLYKSPPKPSAFASWSVFPPAYFARKAPARVAH